MAFHGCDPAVWAGAVGVRAAVHPEHSRCEAMVLGDRADAQERGDDRCVQTLGERKENLEYLEGRGQETPTP